MTVTTTGWDINPRVLGVVPKEYAIGTIAGFHWVMDGQFTVVPKGTAPERLDVVLDIISYLLSKPGQAFSL